MALPYSCLFVLFLFVPGDGDLRLSETGELAFRFPDGFFEEKPFQRRLFSGLTTTIVLELELSSDRSSPKETAFALMEIRYQVWEEVLWISLTEADGRRQDFQVAQVADLLARLEKNPIRLSRPGQIPASKSFQASVTCKVYPFSRGEIEEARKWISKVVNVPEGGARNPVNPAQRRSLGRDNRTDSIFEIILRPSLERRLERSYRWHWQIENGEVRSGG